MGLIDLADKALRGHRNPEIAEALRDEFIDGVSDLKDDSFGVETGSVVRFAIRTSVQLDDGYLPGGIIGFMMHQLRRTRIMTLEQIGKFASRYASQVSLDGSWKTTWLDVAEGRGQFALVATRQVTDRVLKSHFFAEAYMAKALRGDEDAEKYRYDIQNRLSPKEAAIFSHVVSTLEYLYGKKHDSCPTREMLADMMELLEQGFGDISKN